jgi:hypothetical protein
LSLKRKHTSNTRKIKPKIKIKVKTKSIKINKWIYCGVPPMSAKFNVFSQTVQQLTAAPQVGWKMMPLLLVVVGPKWPGVR